MELQDDTDILDLLKSASSGGVTASKKKKRRQAKSQDAPMELVESNSMLGGSPIGATS